MMITVLTASPRDDKKSISKRMVFEFLEKKILDKKSNDKKFKDADVHFIDTYKYSVQPCIHCAHCKKVFECIYDDDYAIYDDAFNNSDILIFATPVYCLSFPSTLKAVLDRMQKYFEAKYSLGIKQPVAKHKDAYLIASSGSCSDRGVKIMEEQLSLVFRAINAELKDTIFRLDTDKYNML
ncbi:MAG: hypothetical protein Ta2G_06620 [Termitinemataceae bacterium]|nr:MAG: hypothetical protein Ta2G_06620 [Termitinemataceae bacterium]